MRVSDFSYDLPHDLIAQRPPPERTGSRLLALAGGRRHDLAFTDLPALLRAGDLLVLNDTRVIPARLYAHKPSGGRVEILLERSLGGGRVLAQLRASKPVRAGGRLLVEGAGAVTVPGRSDGFHELDFGGEDALQATLQRAGHVPLPPYIRRTDEPVDTERYQTVYARVPGAVAAPTAGLHFDEAMLRRLRAAGVATAGVTLHVGAGTFQPVRTESVEDHRMHAEHVEVGAATCESIRRARAAGRRVVAVGTTVVRALESAAAGGEPAAFTGDTRIFIYPGHRFRVVDALLTNFHLPCSTLLMLVCAFAGTTAVMDAYRHAVAARYRFYSYGDAMFLEGAGEQGA